MYVYVCVHVLCTCVQSLSLVQLQLHGLWTIQCLYPWDSPGKNIAVGCHFLLLGIFLTQGSNLHLLNLLLWHMGSLPLRQLGSPGMDVGDMNGLENK